jgi:hypothetical protein
LAGKRRNQNPVEHAQIKLEIIFHLSLERAECQGARADESRKLATRLAGLGSACLWRAGFGVAPKQTFSGRLLLTGAANLQEEVRERQRPSPGAWVHAYKHVTAALQPAFAQLRRGRQRSG